MYHSILFHTLISLINTIEHVHLRFVVNIVIVDLDLDHDLGVGVDVDVVDDDDNYNLCFLWL